jgi:hypothetical protein
VFFFCLRKSRTICWMASFETSCGMVISTVVSAYSS